jgi:predicted nuclease with RNAse H fold
MKTSSKTIVGIDLAAKPLNPIGWALLKDSEISAKHLFNNKEIVAETVWHAPTLTAIDAPLCLPRDKRQYMREADGEMQGKGYPVLPPRFRFMEKLTLRAEKIALKIKEEGLVIIEVHPVST